MKRFYLETIRGQRRGAAFFLFRGVLFLGTMVYVLLHATRRFFYRVGIFRTERFPIPVVSVGNLTAGGTGKTPFVGHLARWFARKNLRVVILARGYGHVHELGRDDEDLFAEMEIENVVRLTGKDRVAQARRALQDLRPDIFILDDGFQHYRIHRDLDILMVDVTNPFAGGRRIPRGLLREHPSQAGRADMVVLSRCDQVDAADLESVCERLDRYLGTQPVIQSGHRPTQVRLLSSRSLRDITWLKDRPILAFCGIGNPDAFRRTLEAAGAQILNFRAFEDHHVYLDRDVQQINATAQEFMVEAVVTTEKDALKLKAEAFTLPLAVVTVEIEVLRGEVLLEKRLRELVEERLRMTTPTTSS